MWEALEHVGWVSTIATTGWLYVIFSVTHYFTLLFTVGTIVLVDLRVMGFADRNQTLAQLADQLLPWTWVGFAFAVVSGFILFTTDAGDFAPDWVFQAKMITIVVAAIFTAVVHSKVSTWTKMPAVPTGAKVLALISLLLWLGTILWGVDIAAISGLG